MILAMMLPRRYRNTILKLLVILSLLWLVVTLFIQSDSHNKSENSQKSKEKPQSQARVDLLHKSNRLGELLETFGARR